jgi:hypothetical protein
MLYDYQENYITNLPKRAIMDVELGLGKTIMALEYIKRHADPNIPLLIVAPAAKTRSGDWKREIDAVWGDDKRPEIRIISRERLAVMKIYSKPLWWQFVPKFGGHQYNVLWDEVQLGARNPSNSIFQKMKYITEGSDIFLGLSGTPLPNGWRDFIGYSLLFKFTPNITTFKARYFNIVRYKGFPEIVGYYHEDEMSEQWKRISRHMTRVEAGASLPDRQIIPVDFTPSYNELKEYRRIKTERTTLEGKLLDTSSALWHATRQSLIPLKLDYLRSILANTTENVVIFYNYNTERDAILGLLKGFSEKTLYECNGLVKSLPSKPEWFGVHNSVTLVQYKSGARAIELTYATITVFFGLTYSYEEYKQSLGRTYRNGQEQKTVVYCFRVLDTIEKAVWSCLAKKQDFNDNLYDE